MVGSTTEESRSRDDDDSEGQQGVPEPEEQGGFLGSLDCDECGALMDPEEAEDNRGICWECSKYIKMRRIQSRLPSNMQVREVAGNHRKPCSECGKKDWFPGDLYIFDAHQPRGTGKYCADCAETKYWSCGEGDLDDDEQEILHPHTVMAHPGLSGIGPAF